MRCLTLILYLLLSSSLAVAETSVSKNYWTYQEFTHQFTHKQQTETEFADFVRSSGEPYQGKSTKPVNIAIIYPGEQASDYWRRSVSSFEARLKSNKMPYIIRTYFSKPGAEINLQEKQLAEALRYNPDYLIYTLDALKHKVIIERLIARHRPKVILQNITTPLKQWGENQPFMYVGFDHQSGTNILAKAFLNRFKQGNYAIFYGPKGYVSKMRGATFKNIIKKESNLNLVAEYYVGFNRKKSYKAAIKLLTDNPDIEFIYSCSTDIALGIIDAIKELGLSGKVITNGWGGGDAELAALQDGTLSMTVMRMNDDNGVAMADSMLWQRSDKQTPTVYSGDMVLITKNMSKQNLSKLTKRAFRYSDQWTSDIHKTLKSIL